jgi:hypothetical protein
MVMILNREEMISDMVRLMRKACEEAGADYDEFVAALDNAFDARFEGSILLGVYASEEEARTAHGVYTRDGDQFIQHYYVVRQVVGAPVDSDAHRVYIG